MKYKRTPFWEVVEKAKWTEHFDYIEGRNKIKKFKDETYIADFIDLRNELEEKIDSLGREWYDENIGLGDDGLNDLIANIIGHGKETYEDVLQHPEKAKEFEAIESFLYVFY